VEKLAKVDVKRFLKVAVLGAECTGKTSLIEGLAANVQLRAYDVSFVPELLRDFCVKHARTPRQEEQLPLMQAQCAELIAESPIVIADCAPITTALYSQMVFNDQSLIARATQFHKEHIDLHLILWPEFSWTADPLPFMRDGIVAQNQFDQLLNDWLANNPQLCWVRLSGSLTHRTETASAAIVAAYARGPE
jgi:HTH-type transcriptional regulator, transcriptional repressor of NAD biosynthesis genes